MADHHCVAPPKSQGAAIADYVPPQTTPPLSPLAGVQRMRAALQAAGGAISTGNTASLVDLLVDAVAADIGAWHHVVSVRLPGARRITRHRIEDDTGVRMSRKRLLREDPEIDPRSRLTVCVRSMLREYGSVVVARKPGETFDDGERELLEAYADCAATALDAMAALGEATRERDRSRSLLELSRMLAGAAPSDEIALRLVDAVRLVVDCDRVTVLLWDAGRRELVERASGGRTLGRDDEPGSAITQALAADGLLDRLLEGAMTDPIFLACETRPSALRRVLTHDAGDAALVVPLVAHDGFLGLLEFAVVERPERLDPSADLLDRLDEVAAQTTAALQNGKLVDAFAQYALHDSLTGLANRFQFYEMLQEAIDRAASAGSSLAVLFIDLDGFKPINDECGHEVGDELLIAVGQRLRGRLRGTDTVGRLGGDEFAILMENASGLEYVEERLAKAFQEPFSAGGRELRVGASIGSARYPEDARSSADLVRVADAAMYDVKRTRSRRPRDRRR